MTFLRRDLWLGRVDPIRLDACRVAVAASLLAYTLAWWRHAEEWLTTAGFHLSAAAVRHVPVAPPLPSAWLPWFGAALFGSILALLVGWKTRWAAWACCACFGYATLVDPLSAYTLNRFFIVKLILLGLAAPACYWSLDRRAPTPQPAWPVRVLQATLLLHYFLAGWAKVAYGDWLKDPWVLWTQANGVYRTAFAAWLLQQLPIGVWAWMQYAALTFELTSPLLIGLRACRPFGVAFGLIFQLAIALLMYQLAYFSLELFSFYVLFLDPGFLHRVHAACQRLWQQGWLCRASLTRRVGIRHTF